MDTRTPLATYPSEQVKRSAYVGNYETASEATDPTAAWNTFLHDHPETAQDLAERLGEHHGELHELDLRKEADQEQLMTVARACYDILSSDAIYELKRNACRAKLGTVVRMQNPGLATEECIVFKKAKELDRNFELDQAMMYRFQGVSLDALNAMPNPADEMLAVFNDHVDEAYNMGLLESRASATLAPFIGYINPAMARKFEALVNHEQVDDPTRVAVFGANVTSRLVTLA